MTRFLGCLLATLAVVVLTSFALSTRPATPTVVGLWTSSHYPLDRAFRVEFSYTSLPMTLPVPPTQGLIITQIKVAEGYSGLAISVNGSSESFTFNTTNDPRSYELNPPIIARPGQVLHITSVGGGAGSPRFTLGGYTTLPGET
jgi:hypothetical protein